jgi:hypothetical protein
MEWYTRNVIWKRASEEQIKAAINYIETNQPKQSVGIFKDIRRNEDVIYTLYASEDKLVELLYDTPLHVAYLNRVVGF